MSVSGLPSSETLTIASGSVGKPEPAMATGERIANFTGICP